MRIVGVNIPDDKKIKIALTYVFGVGRSLAEEILDEAGVDEGKRAEDLSSKEVNKLQSVIDENYKVEGELRQERKQNIRRLKEIDSYRGDRHEKDLPVRGQTTQKNSRTVRGNVRKTVGSGKRKVELK